MRCRGTGETLGEDRSKAGITKAEDKPAANGAAGGADEAGVEVLVKTPGTDVFRREFERLVLGMH